MGAKTLAAGAREDAEKVASVLTVIACCYEEFIRRIYEMMQLVKICVLLENESQKAVDACGEEFVTACQDAAKYLVKQGEEIAELEEALREELSEKEYLRSRMRFFAEVAGAHDNVIMVEGYRAFRGTMKITPKTARVPSYELTGDWLYKPEYDCWYGKGSSFAADICTIMEVTK